jgi:hypothetical protein
LSQLFVDSSLRGAGSFDGGRIASKADALLLGAAHREI